MAEIGVEPEGRRIWPWIAGLVVLALVIWALAEWTTDDAAVERETVETVGGGAAPAPPPARLILT